MKEREKKSFDILTGSIETRAAQRQTKGAALENANETAKKIKRDWKI